MNWKKIITRSLAALALLTIGMAYLANRDMIKIYGGLTKVVDDAQFELQDRPIIVRNVNILSPDGSKFLPNRTVSIKQGLIESISSDMAYSTEANIIDGQGKYLIPGLTDSHVHLFKSQNDLLLYLANGITQVREMIGEKDHLVWRDEIDNGRLGPEMFIASPRIGSFGLIEGAFMTWSQGFLNINDPSNAVEQVKKLHSQGYDAVKIYSHINKESYFAVTNTAKSLGMRVVGHVPWSLEITDLYSQQHEVAHLEEIMNAMNREFGGYGYNNTEEFLNYVRSRSDDIASQLRDNNIAVTTVLWLVESFVKQKFDLNTVLQEVELEYENPGISEWTERVPEGGLGWLPGVNRYQGLKKRTDAEKADSKRYWETYAKACQIILKSLIKNQVSLMAGTDTNLPPTVPGFALHDEFKSMHRAGMSAAHILRSATSEPAQWLDNNAGVIVAGKKANLVLLDQNPLEDIRHTKAINSVIINGRLLNRNTLDNILLAVKHANDVSRTRDIKHYAH